jgi:CheY-like chemotaxis protein
MDTVAVELVRLLPELLWFALAVALIYALWQPIRHELLPNLVNMKAGGIELSFLREAMDRAVELAEKSPKWHIVVPPKCRERVLRRARRAAAVVKGGEVLWIDDDHSNNRNERRMLRQLDVAVTTVANTDEALAALQEGEFDLVLSDMGRGAQPAAGLALLPALKERGREVPVIFYVGNLEPERGVPPGAFGITNRPDELLHLILDALERVRG